MVGPIIGLLLIMFLLVLSLGRAAGDMSDKPEQWEKDEAWRREYWNDRERRD